MSFKGTDGQVCRSGTETEFIRQNATRPRCESEHEHLVLRAVSISLNFDTFKDQDCPSVKQLQAQFDAVDTSGSGVVSLSEVIEYLVLVCGTEDPSMVDLLQKAAQLWFDDMVIDLGKQNQLTKEEWLHSMMIKQSAPSHTAAFMLNQRLRRSTALQAGWLKRSQQAFMEADVMGHGRLRSSEWLRVLEKFEIPSEEFGCFDLNGDGELDYFEFMSLLVGTQPQDIELAMYDISNGHIKWVPSALTSGHKFEGLWHTSILAFGKEFWYGGNIFQSVPFQTPFGEPTRTIKLGSTIRTRKELLRYMAEELRWEYTCNNYDVFSHNCNHFSNDVTKFLLDNVEIPEEVRMQPKWAQSGFAVRALRPMLNRLLGQFGSDAGTTCQQHIDDLTDEWRLRLKPGDFVVHRARFADPPNVARVTKVHRQRGSLNTPTDSGVRTVDLVMFVLSGEDSPTASSFAVEPRQLQGVCLRELFPLRRGAAFRNDDVVKRRGRGDAKLFVADAAHGDEAEVLCRKVSVAQVPRCNRGHVLQQTSRLSTLLARSEECQLCSGLVSQGACCGARRKGSGERMQCYRCNFTMCSDCVIEGMRFDVFADLIHPEIANELLQRPVWLRYRANCYYDRADSNLSNDLDKDELASVVERICVELGVPVKEIAAEELDMDRPVRREEFVIIFRSLLQKCVLYNAGDDE